MMNFDKERPRTLDEAIDQLEEGLSARDAAVLAKTGPDGQHHVMGRNIRNGWDLWDRGSPIVRWFKRRYGVDHADDISGLILGGLHSRITGAPFDPEADAAMCRAHWQRMENGSEGFSGKLIPDDLHQRLSPKRGFWQRLLSRFA